MCPGCGTVTDTAVALWERDNICRWEDLRVIFHIGRSLQFLRLRMSAGLNHGGIDADI